MHDVELVRALERGDVPDDGFPHASHLRVAWVYLAESASVEEAEGRMAGTLRRFAASVGKAGKYHHTITLFWMRMLAAGRAANPGDCLEQILARHPALLDKNLLHAFYSPGRIDSDEARLAWVDPDLQPILMSDSS